MKCFALQVCLSSNLESDGNEDGLPNETIYGIPKIAWPFIISGCWCVIFSFAYLALGKRCLNIVIERYCKKVVR